MMQFAGRAYGQPELSTDGSGTLRSLGIRCLKDRRERTCYSGGPHSRIGPAPRCGWTRPVDRGEGRLVAHERALARCDDRHIDGGVTGRLRQRQVVTGRQVLRLPDLRRLDDSAWDDRLEIQTESARAAELHTCLWCPEHGYMRASQITITRICWLSTFHRRRSQPPLVNRPSRQAEFHRTTANQHCAARRIYHRKQTVTSPHSAPNGFSPLFSNATTDHASPVQHSQGQTAELKRSIQKRSEPNGDHHLTFIDVSDSAPASPARR